MSNKAVYIWLGGCAVVLIICIVTAIIIFNTSDPYAQNKSPDYRSFAYAYGNAVGAPDFAVEATMPESRLLGDTICDRLRRGVSEKTLTDRLDGTGSGPYRVDRVGAASIVNAAHNYLCSGK